MSLRIVFAGSTAFSVPVLEKLLQSEHDVVAIYTRADKPAGRGRLLAETPVKHFARSLTIPIVQPETFKDTGAQLALKAFKPEVMVVVAYGLILPQAVLDIPRLGCINIHPSRLPKWRGAAPVIRTIEAGENQTAVTIMALNAKMDAGDILSQVETNIGETETADHLTTRLFQLGAEALLPVLTDLEQHRAVRIAQNDQEATHAAMVSKAEAEINWQESATTLANKVRAFHSVPVAFTQFQGNPLRIWEAIALNQTPRYAPGVIEHASKEGVEVACGQGILRLLTVQLPGKKPIAATAYWHAHRLYLVPGQQALG